MATRSKGRERNPCDYSPPNRSGKRRKRHWYGVKQLYVNIYRKTKKVRCFEERIFLLKAANEDELEKILAKLTRDWCSRDDERNKSVYTLLTTQFEIYRIPDCDHGDNPLEIFSHLYRQKRSAEKFLRSQEFSGLLWNSMVNEYKVLKPLKGTATLIRV